MSWLSKLFGKEKKSRAWMLTVNDEEISCTNPEGETQAVAWDHLEEVWLMNFGIDQDTEAVLFGLEGDKAGFSFPMGATPAEADFIRRLGHLPGFNKELVFERLDKAKKEAGEYVLWQRVPRGSSQEHATHENVRVESQEAPVKETGTAAEATIDRQAEMFRAMGFKVGGVEAAKESVRKAAAARPNEPWFDEAIDKMVSVYREHPEGFVQGSGGAPEQELRRIGEVLDRKGGMDLMRAAHAEFSNRCDVRGAARNLEFMWDGIGRWQG
jgi:hypothetical protein